MTHLTRYLPVGGLGVEWWVATEHDVDDYTQRPNVTTLELEAKALNLLGNKYWESC